MIDKVFFDKWDDYIEVKEVMFFYMDMVDVFWMIVKFDDKKCVWLNCMEYFLVFLLYLGKNYWVVG